MPAASTVAMATFSMSQVVASERLVGSAACSGGRVGLLWAGAPDEDALTGALIGGLSGALLGLGRNLPDGCRTAAAEQLAPLPEVAQPVGGQLEEVGGDLLAQPVSRAQILVHQDAHLPTLPYLYKMSIL